TLTTVAAGGNTRGGGTTGTALRGRARRPPGGGASRRGSPPVPGDAGQAAQPHGRADTSEVRGGWRAVRQDSPGAGGRRDAAARGGRLGPAAARLLPGAARPAPGPVHRLALPARPAAVRGCHGGERSRHPAVGPASTT